MRNRQLGPARLLLIWALLAPFFAVSLISNAVMPVRTADGAIMLVICTGEGPSEIAISPIDGQPVETPQGGVAGHCDWASAGHAAATPSRPGLPQRAARLTEPANPAASPAPMRAAATVIRPPATGPPTI